MAAPRDKVIITCAVTGAIHTPTITAYLPITPAEIADGAIVESRCGHHSSARAIFNGVQCLPSSNSA